MRTVLNAHVADSLPIGEPQDSPSPVYAPPLLQLTEVDLPSGQFLD